MKVCLFGDFSENNDEGLKNVAKQLFNELSQFEDLKIDKVDLREKNIVSTIYIAMCLRPDIIHYVPGPSNKSILFLKLLKILMGTKTKFVLSATHPMYNFKLFKWICFKPDLYISSSLSQIRMVQSLDIRALYLSNGVDINKFCSVSEQKKVILRAKYNLKQNVFTLLHVGHLISNRNLPSIKDLAKSNQVVIVASNYISNDKKISLELKKAGCLVFEGYYSNIEEFYQCADCYLFPVIPGNSIDCPLSILEAMACNLPIITTKFDGLQLFNRKCGDIMFIDDSDNLESLISLVKKPKSKCTTREQVVNISWDKIALIIAKEYKLI